jgi:hypothetical protein
MKCLFRKTDDGGGMDGAPKGGGSGGEGSTEKSNNLFLNENREEGEGIVAPKTPILTNKSGNAIGKARFRSFSPLASFLLTIGIVTCQGEVLIKGERGNRNINGANEGTFNVSMPSPAISFFEIETFLISFTIYLTDRSSIFGKNLNRTMEQKDKEGFSLMVLINPVAVTLMVRKREALLI